MTAMGVKFDRLVEVAVSCFRGEEKNKHFDTKLSTHRGTVGKTPVVGIKDRKSKQRQATVVPDTTADTLQGFVETHTVENVKVCTGESTSYRGFSYRESINRTVSQWVEEQVHINGMESFRAALKHGYHGVYHHVSKKHLRHYANEFAERHNFRDYDTIDQMKLIACRLVRKRF